MNWDYYDPHTRVIVEARPTPPVADEDAYVGQMWCDTYLVANAVMKYWDGDEWVRMDGGGDIPDGMVEPRHLSPEITAEIDELKRRITALENRDS